MGRNSRMIEKSYSLALLNHSICGNWSDFMFPVRLSIIINALCRKFIALLWFVVNSLLAVNYVF
jgi:hypothetical protein